MYEIRFTYNGFQKDYSPKVHDARSNSQSYCGELCGTRVYQARFAPV